MDPKHPTSQPQSKPDKKSSKKIRHPSIIGAPTPEPHQIDNEVTELPVNETKMPSLRLDTSAEQQSPKLDIPNTKEASALNYLRDLEEDSDIGMHTKYKEDIAEENDSNSSFRLSPFMGPIRKSVQKRNTEGHDDTKNSTVIKVNKTTTLKRNSITGQVRTRQSRLKTDPNDESRLQKSHIQITLNLNEDVQKRNLLKSSGVVQLVNVNTQVKMPLPSTATGGVNLTKTEELQPPKILQELKGNKNIKSVKDIKALFAENANNALIAQLGYRKALNGRARQIFRKQNSLTKGPENILLVGRSYSVPKFSQQQQGARPSISRSPEVHRGSVDLKKEGEETVINLKSDNKAFTKYINEEKLKLEGLYGGGSNGNSKIYLQSLLKDDERMASYNKKKQLHLKDSISSCEEVSSVAAADGWEKSSLNLAESKPQKLTTAYNSEERRKMNEIQIGFWFKAKKNLINPYYRVGESKGSIEPNDENKVAVKDLLGENILKIGKVPGSFQLKGLKSIQASPKREENINPILTKSNWMNPGPNPRIRLMSRQSYSFKEPLHHGEFIHNPSFSKTSTRGFKINIPVHKKSFTEGETQNKSAREEIKKPLEPLKFPIRGGINTGIAKTAR